MEIRGKISWGNAVTCDKVAEALREEIRAGAYGDAERFPSLTMIMRRFGISRPSAVKSVEELKKLGLVRTRKGAGTFVSRKSRAIGIAIPGTADSEFFKAVMDSLVDCCRRCDFDLVAGGAFPADHAKRAAKAERLARHFAEKKVAGVIMQPVGFNADAAKTNAIIHGVLSEASIPVVLLDYDITEAPERSGCDLVAIDNFAAGRRIAAHLIRRGAKRIACLLRRLSAESVWTRYDGVAAEARRAGGVAVENIEAEPDDARAVAAGLRRFRPDAVVCSNDQAAVALEKTLAKLGVRVPGDLMLAGFDDVRAAGEAAPPLTTVRQPCRALATMAFRTLLARIARPKLPPMQVLLDAPLVVRESTTRTIGGAEVE